MEKRNYDEWIDLTNEKSRTYYFGDGSTYTVYEPQKLWVRKSGSHRLIDAAGQKHYITSKWNTFSAIGEWKFTVG